MQGQRAKPKQPRYHLFHVYGQSLGINQKVIITMIVTQFQLLAYKKYFTFSLHDLNFSNETARTIKN